MADTDQYIGKHLLAGITFLDHEENVTRHIQVHGTITRIDGSGIFFIQPNGEEFSLPPDLKSLKTAKPGSYRLRSTGEVVENPDLITSWTRKAPPPEKSR
jgi:hypothetical protein